MENENLLEIRGVNKFFKKRGKNTQVLADIDLRIRPGECVGMVGASGSGKSTIARMLCLIHKPESGEVLFRGEDIFALRPRDYFRQVQMVFQDPLASFPPRMRVETFLLEPFRNYGLPEAKDKNLARDLLAHVHLEPDLLGRFPNQLSGGQLQRIVFARATGMRPALVICDEATSALDATIQAQVVALLRDLQARIGFACLFITHDLALAESLCARIHVMEDGKIVEELAGGNITRDARHPATLELIRACEHMAAFADCGADKAARRQAAEPA